MIKKEIEYQIRLNDKYMENEEGEIADNFMDLVIQFGYISFFGTVFPPAALICFCFNIVTLSSMKNDFQYKKRRLPEVSIGIGTYINMIEQISIATVAVNSMIAIFTSQKIK